MLSLPPPVAGPGPGGLWGLRWLPSAPGWPTWEEDRVRARSQACTGSRQVCVPASGQRAVGEGEAWGRAPPPVIAQRVFRELTKQFLLCEENKAKPVRVAELCSPVPSLPCGSGPEKPAFSLLPCRKDPPEAPRWLPFLKDPGIREPLSCLPVWNSDSSSRKLCLVPGSGLSCCMFNPLSSCPVHWRV